MRYVILWYFESQLVCVLGLLKRRYSMNRTLTDETTLQSKAIRYNFKEKMSSVNNEFADVMKDICYVETPLNIILMF